MDTKYQVIKKIADESNGLVTTKQIENHGLNRTVIRNYVEKNLLIREAQGVYSIASDIADEYKLVQIKSNKMIFSYGTSLYLHEMSDRIPDILDVTVPQGFNVSRIKRVHQNLRFHYVKPLIWELGAVDLKSPMGAEVKVYDKERTICDIIVKKKYMDVQTYTQAIKEYFRQSPDLPKLLKYAKILGTYDRIMDYIEVLA